MAIVDTVLPPVTERSTVVRWVRKNLFGSWIDSLLTVLGALIAYWAIRGFLTWALNTAEWEVIAVNLRLLLIGQYPLEHAGRLWLWLGFLTFLSGNSLGIWARQSRYAALLLFAPALLALLPFVIAGD